MRKIVSLLIVIVILLCCAPVYSDASLIIDSLVVDESGAVEVIGHATEWNENTQITCLAMTADASSSETITGDKILYIDQITVGNNGVFLIEFIVNERFSKESAVLRIGSDTGAEPASVNFNVPKLPPTIEAVANNSVKYGCDVYRLDSSNLTSENVIDSIVTGGNTIYYKLGDKWYDLLNEKATTSAYLVPDNAMSDTAVKELPVRYYYVKGVRVNLAGATEVE